MSAIVVADVVVVDATVRSMSLDRQLTYALQKGKPALVLRHSYFVCLDWKLFIK